MGFGSGVSLALGGLAGWVGVGVGRESWSLLFLDMIHIVRVGAERKEPSPPTARKGLPRVGVRKRERERKGWGRTREVRQHEEGGVGWWG